MKSFQNLISILSILFLVSCGQKVETTDTTLQIIKGRAVISSANAAGGIVVYGKNEKGDNFGRVLDPGGGGVINLMLPNGNWEFTAITWEGPTAFTGTLRCAFSPPQFLNGMSANVNLNLTNSNCSSPKFTPYYATTGGAIVFPNLTLYSCKNLSFSPGVTNTDCDTTEDASNKGYLASFKVILEQFDQFNNGPLGIHGPVLEKCIVTTAHAFNTTTSGSISMDSISSAAGIILPAGDGSFPMSVKIVGFFDSTTCAYSSAGEKHFTFPKGVGAPMGSSEYTKYPWSSGAAIGFNLYLKSTETDVCQGPRLSTNYAGGTGTKGNPYLICTPNQYNYVATNYVTNESLRLANDLNFNDSAISVIGGTSTGANPPFNGIFLGEKHTISNFKINLQENDVGLIRTVDTNGIVNQLNIANAYITNGQTLARARTGAIVGDVILGKLRHIKVKSTNILGDQYVGGIAGSVSASSSLTDVHFNGFVNSKHGSNSYAGGIVGSLNGSISEATVDAKIFGSNEGVGGIVGVMNSGQIIKARTSGVVESKKSVGGIAGVLVSGTINNTYSIANVLCSSRRASPSCYAGGLLGTFTAGTLSESFFYGSVSSNTGAHGGLVSLKSGGTITNAYFEDPSMTGCFSGCANPSTTVAINLNLSGITVTTVLSSGGAIFYKPSGDDNYDIPRLSFEVNIEPELSYLSRQCSGSFATSSAAIGAGTASDPYWVCNPTHFREMTGSNYYILKHNLNFVGMTPVGSKGYFSTGGAINFDGANKAISNLKMELNDTTVPSSDMSYGVFKTVTGTIKNLRVHKVVTNQASSVSSNNVYNAGNTLKFSGLTASNTGTIDNVHISGAEFGLGISSSTSTTSHIGSFAVTDYQGFMASANYGTITNSSVTGMVKALSHLTSTPDDNFLLGGVVGFNDTAGTISKTSSEIEFHSAVNNTFLQNTLIGGVAGKNYGTISQASSGGDFSISPASITLNTYYVGGIAGLNNNSISNAYSTINMQKASAPAFGYWGGIVGSNVAGTITKTYYAALDSTILNNITNLTIKGGIVGNNGGGTISNSFCLDLQSAGNGFVTPGAIGVGSGTNIVYNTCPISNPLTTFSLGTTLSNNSSIYYNDWGFTDNIVNPSSSYTWMINSPFSTTRPPAIPVGVARRSF